MCIHVEAVRSVVVLGAEVLWFQVSNVLWFQAQKCCGFR